MANIMVRCNYCIGTGKVGSGYGSYGKTTCPVCFGRGKISIDANAKRCVVCNGTGRQNTGYHTLGTVKHNVCHGTGWITSTDLQAARSLASAISRR